MADADDRTQGSGDAKPDAIALAELAEAEADAAEAAAEAARARARAIKLRQETQSEQKTSAEQKTAAEHEAPAEEKTPAEPEAAAEPAAAAEPETTETTETPETPEPAGPRRVISARVLTAAGSITLVALLGAGAWMAWQHHNVEAQRQRAAAYVATARQGVVNLTSLDYNKAKEDVQRVLDIATGDFKDDFQKRAEDFASVVKDSKAVTEGSVAATAVESMNKDSAVVLVLANERVTNIAGAKDQPRTFRFRVSVVHDGDDLKVSKVEFVL